MIQPSASRPWRPDTRSGPAKDRRWPPPSYTTLRDTILAQTMEREEQRAALIETAEVWEKLARERELTATDAEESAG